MSPFEESTTSKEFWVQGVIPTAIGLIGTFFGLLYMCGAICSGKKRGVAPTLLNQGDNPVSQDDGRISTTEAERKYGPVACEARLWGLEAKERRAVLESIFSNLVHKDVAEEPDRHGAGHSQAPSCCVEDCLERGNADSGEHFASGDHTEHSSLDMRFSCAICLREYEKGDALLKGASCNHKFHWECAMIWMTKNKKPKDHCPYCRGKMITAKEMKTAALEVLGEERVNELMANELAESKDVLATIRTVPTVESMTNSTTEVNSNNQNGRQEEGHRTSFETGDNDSNPGYLSADEIEV
jgi:hypothetical protein